jgi:outer membrane protein insertion porin family
MKALFRLCGLCALLSFLGGTAGGQLAVPKVATIAIKHVGPAAVSDELIRANVRVKPGDPYLPTAVDDDVRSLYDTGLFYNVRVIIERGDDGLALTYVVQAKPRLTDIKFQGNQKISTSKLEKKVTSKVGEPLDERKLFTDSQAIQEAYQKKGYPRTEVKYVVNIDEAIGRGTATFEIKESPKIRITQVQFVGAQAFPEKVGFFEKLFHPSRTGLSSVIKTRKRWMFSWLTGRGNFKDDQFEEDRERLAEFYREKGYVDFEIKDVQFENPTPTTMIIRLNLFEGRQYKVGAVTFAGTTMMPTNRIAQVLNLKPGAVFVPKNMAKDIETVEDFYGARGHIDVTASSGNLQVKRLANTGTGTMDLQYKVDEGQPSYIEKIEIRGNTKTKNTVIRREMAVSPGELFDMVRVKVSRRRLEGLQYFEKVDARSEDTDVPNRKNLMVSVEEKNTGNLTMGAGFSSVDSLVGFVEVSQGNFDLFHPPTFTGGGQKFRLRVQLGTERQDYVLSFVEPWFLGRKLALGVELYHRNLNFQSVENLYDELRTGARLSLTRALWSDYLIGSINYTIENVGIDLNSGLHGPLLVREDLPGRGQIIRVLPANVPQAILDEEGNSLISKVGFSLAYDTRNSTMLPDHGQRTELSTDFVGGPLGGDKEYYKVELKSAWYFRGLAKGHVLEVAGRTGVADSLGGSDVPFYDRYYLGGLYSLRGFEYRGISPRDPSYGINPLMPNEPIGGNTYWFGTAEYSIPIIQKEKTGGVRFALFYDIGSVAAASYKFDFSNFSDDWGIGLRLNLPIGPLRLDYAFPIHHDQFNGSSGRFQFGVGYTREF